MGALPALGLVGAAAAFGAIGLTLALVGAGAPFLAASLGASVLAGLVIYGVGRSLTAPRPKPRPFTTSDLESQVRLLEESSAVLRHDLRGVLSPALMMADRLLRNEDPAIRRAGLAVVRSVERATALIAENRAQSPAAADKAGPDAAGPPPRSQAVGTAAPGGAPDQARL
jgi:hypothetical protein